MRVKGQPFKRTLFGAGFCYLSIFCTALFHTVALKAATQANGIDPVIQIFTGGLDGEGVISSSLHLNGVPAGPSKNLPPGMTKPSDLLLITPELDYGLLSSLEASVYVPMVANLQGGFDVAGGIGRLTWVPWDVPEEGGFFAGTTWAFSGYRRQFSVSSYSLNGGFTTGYENDDWLLALNGFVNWDLSGAASTSTPSFSPAVGIKRYWGDHLGLGVEYYGDIGSIAKPDPINQQYQALFGVVDWDEDRWSLNLGVGRGMTANSDEWMIKMIFFALIGEPAKNDNQKEQKSFTLNRTQGVDPYSAGLESGPKADVTHSHPYNVLGEPASVKTVGEEDDEE